MRLLIAVTALLLLSLTGPVPASAATPSLPSVHNDRPAPGGVQHHTHGDTLTEQHNNSPDSVHNTTQHISKLFPCPDQQDIAPCNCSVDDELRLSLDCSAVVSDEQLASVFTAYFPATEYYKFVIDENDNITQLGLILNGVTFEYVSLTGVNNLELVWEDFLLDSSETLNTLIIENSALTRLTFPFLTLPLYSQLQSLYFLYSSQLTSIPHLISDSLTYINFFGCAISNIDPGHFDAVSQLQMLGLHGNDLTSLQPGTFTLTNSLQDLYLYNNQLTTIEPGAFVVPENSGPTSSLLYISLHDNSLSSLASNTFVMADRPHTILLYSNSLSSLAAGAFVLPQTTEQFSLFLDLNSNALISLEEQVLGELFPYITILRVEDNPLACGCDVAWLVLNPEYMAKIYTGATCADGRLFQDLDPAYYEAFC